MRKVAIFALVLVLIFLGACGKEKYDTEVTENEKISLNLDLERRQLEDIFNHVEDLEAIESIELEDGGTVEYYEPNDFTSFIMPGGYVNEASKIIRIDDEGNEIERVSIVYTLRNRSIIVDYYSDGSIDKSMLNRETGYIIMNENDEKFTKFHTDQVKGD